MYLENAQLSSKIGSFPRGLLRAFNVLKCFMNLQKGVVKCIIVFQSYLTVETFWPQLTIYLIILINILST